MCKVFFTINSYILSPYSYDKRGLSGKWFIFGAKLECGDKICQIKEKLIEQGYSIENQDEKDKKIKMLPCQKLFDLANQIKLDTVPVIIRDKVGLNLQEKFYKIAKASFLSP